LWTLLASAAYSSYLYPALNEYSIDAAGYTVLAIRIFFFFLVGMVVKPGVVAYRSRATVISNCRAVDGDQSRFGTGPCGNAAFERWRLWASLRGAGA